MDSLVNLNWKISFIKLGVRLFRVLKISTDGTTIANIVYCSFTRLSDRKNTYIESLRKNLPS